MGATGKTLSSGADGKIDVSTFGAGKSVIYDGKIPANSGLEYNTKNVLTLKSPSGEKDIIFQFKLLDNNKMSIRAYDPNVPEKGKVSITTSSASLDSVPASQKGQAAKIRDMMNRTKSGVKESSLPKIANALKSNQNWRKKL